MRRIAAIIGALACCAAGPAVAQAATTRYVATAVQGGNDNGGSNTCNNQVAPCLTVQQAVNKAVSGDTIQIGPGRFPGAVKATSKALTFAGAGSGTATSFDPATDTYIDAGATSSPALSTGNHDATVQGLRIRGGGSSQSPAPAISPAGGSAVPTLTVSDSVVLQASPTNPDQVFADAISAASVSAGTGLSISISGSTIVPFRSGIFLKEPSGTLSISNTAVLAPAPVTSAVLLPTAVDSENPVSLKDDTLTGTIGIEDVAKSATISGTTIRASEAGVRLYDLTDAPTLAIRDSVIAPDSGTLESGVVLIPPATPSLEVPALDLTFDSIVARAAPPAYALDLQGASPGTRITTRNTILQAIDTSGGTGADEIAASDGLSWDVGYTDFQHTLGSGIPAPGSGTNLDLDPGFTDAAGGDLTLAPGSPLFDRGDPAVVQSGETDLSGAARSVAHSCGAPALPDLGAYEAPAPTCTPPPPPPPPKPSLGKLTASHRTFRPGGKLAKVSAKPGHRPRPPVGTTFKFTLNTAATLKLAFTRIAIRCSRHSHHCKHTAAAGSLSLSGHAGTDRIAFGGRVSRHHKLKPGTYRLSLSATNSAGHSKTRSLKFTIA